MYGVVASQRWAAGGGAVPPWVPDGALAFLDFVNGNYWATVTGDMSDFLGGALDEGDIAASGMAVWHTNGNAPLAIGGFRQVIVDGLAEGMTLLFDID
jgi:hypothetical protein